MVQQKSYFNTHMDIFGIDFTSRPSRKKPLTCATCTFADNHLSYKILEEWASFTEFEQFLQRQSVAVTGIDFPFGQSRRFIENSGWPKTWDGYISHVATLEREEFRQVLEDYKKDRADGDKEHRRQNDIAAGSISPQKLYGVPVALMFYEGAPRLLQSNVSIPGLRNTKSKHIVVEAYPGVLARALIGRLSYKNDTKEKQTVEQFTARKDILAGLGSPSFKALYGFSVDTPENLVKDPTGDNLDAYLCAIQAAWAYKSNFKRAEKADPLEGWIAHPF